MHQKEPKTFEVVPKTAAWAERKLPVTPRTVPGRLPRPPTWPPSGG
jgi:hypothetical protein